MSWLNHRPAGVKGPVQAGPDGELYAGDEKLRFLGVNLCFGANTPRKEDSAVIAARMAKFGVTGHCPYLAGDALVGVRRSGGGKSGPELMRATVTTLTGEKLAQGGVPGSSYASAFAVSGPCIVIRTSTYLWAIKWLERSWPQNRWTSFS